LGLRATLTYHLMGGPIPSGRRVPAKGKAKRQ
jgi:hypothetical protein